MTPGDGKALLDVRGLRVTVGRGRMRHEAVRGVELHLRSAECVALVGESGSGKSLTLRALIGLAGPGTEVHADRLSVLGGDALGYSESEWRSLRGRQIGLVLQDAQVALDPYRKVGAEVAEAPARHRMVRRRHRSALVQQLLTDVGVPEPRQRARQYPHELSGGLCQRVLIASALSARPAILLADEPTSALDATVARQILRFLRELREQGVGLVFVSHDLAAVAQVADRMVVLHQGAVVESGPVAEVLRDPQHPRTRALVDAAPSLSGRARLARGRPDPMRDRRPVIEVSGATRRYPTPDGGTLVAVADLDLTVGDGECVGIVGESGSGKTTVAKLLVGSQLPDSGTVTVRSPDGAELPLASRARHKVVQLVHQNVAAALDPRWTVARSILEVIKIEEQNGGAPASDRLHALLREVGLSTRLLSRRPHELSGGQRQRVVLARALALRPRILICDEAVSALDTTVQSQVLDLLSTLRQTFGLTLLFISHDLGVVARLCERVVVMKDGRIVEDGPVEDVLYHPRDPYTAELVSSVASTERSRRSL